MGDEKNALVGCAALEETKSKDSLLMPTTVMVRWRAQGQTEKQKQKTQSITTLGRTLGRADNDKIMTAASYNLAIVHKRRQNWMVVELN